jgi:hypothetical protein
LTATVFVLWLLHASQRHIVEPLLPISRAVMGFVDGRFQITEAAVVPELRGDTLRIGVILAAPLSIAGKTVYPFGWFAPAGVFTPGGELMPSGGAVPSGEYRVDWLISGMLVYGAVSLILILAWPANRPKELFMRLLAVAVFWMLFLTLDIPAYALCLVWDTLQERLNPGGSNGWLVWRRFLADGGGVALGLCVAAVAVVWAERFGKPVRRVSPKSEPLAGLGTRIAAQGRRQSVDSRPN